jgi:hypothetical protein
MRYFVSTPYNSAKSESSMTFCPRMTWILVEMGSGWAIERGEGMISPNFEPREESGVSNKGAQHQFEVPIWHLKGVT